MSFVGFVENPAAQLKENLPSNRKNFVKFSLKAGVNTKREKHANRPVFCGVCNVVYWSYAAQLNNITKNNMSLIALLSSPKKS